MCTAYPRDNNLIVYVPDTNEQAVNIMRQMLYDYSIDEMDTSELDAIWQRLRADQYCPNFRYFVLTEE